MLFSILGLVNDPEIATKSKIGIWGNKLANFTPSLQGLTGKKWVSGFLTGCMRFVFGTYVANNI